MTDISLLHNVQTNVDSLVAHHIFLSQNVWINVIFLFHCLWISIRLPVAQCTERHELSAHGNCFLWWTDRREPYVHDNCCLWLTERRELSVHGNCFLWLTQGHELFGHGNCFL